MEDIGLEKRHKDRLRRLANAVERQVEDGWFDLGSYHGSDGCGQEPDNIAFFKHTCGTTACLMGWAPSLLRSINVNVVGNVVTYRVDNQHTTDIEVAGERLFGLTECQYNWLFMPGHYRSEHNADWPTTRKGAVARIRAFLSVGGDIGRLDSLEPKDFIR